MNVNLLKSKRILHKKTQKEMSVILGISHKAYNFKESGKYDFKMNEVLLLSHALKLSLNDVNAIFFENSLPIV